MGLVGEIIAAFAFFCSSGLICTERFRNNWIVLGPTSLIAVISSTLLFIQIWDWVTKPAEKGTAGPPAYVLSDNGDDVFTSQDLAELAQMSERRPCWTECGDAKYHMLRLPADDIDFQGPRVYLVTTQNKDFCGNSGCYNAMMVLRNGRMFMTNAPTQALSDRQAALVARDILAQVRR